MTPEERNLVIELFDRLATLEDAQRDPEAERLIRDGLRQAPNAPYALVQTVLVQDEALKRADARIRELEGAVATDTEPRDASFLGGMRDSLFGKREGRGSVPSVRSAEPASTSAPVSPAWHTGTQAPMPAATQAPMPVAPAGVPGAPGGSFLGTAAAAAAGVIGGSLLMSGIRSLMGNPQGAHAAFDPASGASGSSPWSGSEELAREAGLGDIGRTPSSGDDTASRGYGALDDRGNDDEPDDQGADDLDDDGLGFDDNGGDSEE
ncbi:MAG: DUF2076 domain-containing protein [Hyphomicrobiales bacterium]|jgi:uncharacterized protein|nr:DUF2076 domain-containing protein [Xanthobacteraceae bacterium]